MEELHETILNIVNEHSGIKGVELVMLVMARLIDRFNAEDYLRAIQNAAEHGDILELEYIIPAQPEKVKSIYFPKGTQYVDSNIGMRSIN